MTIEVAVISILDLIAARFSNITEENGYFTTVKSIDRGKLTAYKGYDLPALNYWPVSMSNEREYGVDERSFTLYVEYHSKTVDDSFVDVASKLAFDVITALDRTTTAPKVSDAQSPDIGGAISDLVLEGYDYEIGAGQEPWCGVLVRFTVKYRADTNNMSLFSAE